MRQGIFFNVCEPSPVVHFGCENEVREAPVQQETAPTVLHTPLPQPPSPTASPANLVKDPPTTSVADGEYAVSITLVPSQYLKAPIMTLIADTPQTYAIIFKTDMNRKSVEDALLRFAPVGGLLSVKPESHFNWQNDKELLLTVSLQSSDNDQYPTRGYILDVNGALTAKGEVIADSPTFRALVQKPSQLWRVSTTDGHTEKMSSFAEPFYLQNLQDPTYLLAMQFLDYCECDRSLPKLYSVYNLGDNTLTTYPVPLMTQYKGSGDFTVDTRGFFYEQPKDDVPVPPSNSAYSIHIDGYVHGAAISLDRKQVLLAVGEEKQFANLDFIIYEIATKTTRKYAKQLVGEVPESEVSSAKIPVQFQDDGTHVYTYMKKEGIYIMLEYEFAWDSGQLKSWKSPISDHGWSGFMATDDATYRYYYNGGFFHGDEKVQLPNSIYPNVWLHGTHRFVYLSATDNNPTSAQTLIRYDMDDNQSHSLTKLPPGNHAIVGGSADGRWVYVFTQSRL